MYPVAMISLRRMLVGIGVFFAAIALLLAGVYHLGTVGDTCEELWSQVDADELNVNLVPDRCWD